MPANSSILLSVIVLAMARVELAGRAMVGVVELDVIILAVLVRVLIKELSWGRSNQKGLFNAFFAPVYPEAAASHNDDYHVYSKDSYQKKS